MRVFELDSAWAGHIASRHSCRTFAPGPAPEACLAALRSRFERPGLVEGARLVIKDNGAQSVLTGLVGSYGKIGGESFAAFILEPGQPAAFESAGYLGEALVLEATRLGLGTCWVAGTFDPQRAGEAVGLLPGERVAAITPLGLPAEKPRLFEQLGRSIVGSSKRCALEGLLQGGLAPAQWPAWVRPALQAARLAPSARNRQPWRFTVEPGQVKVTAAGGPQEHEKQRLDCGIAMLHLEVAALAAGVHGQWAALPQPGVAVFKALEMDGTSCSVPL
jgi:hypothetical protein